MYRFWKPGSVILFWHASWLSEMNTCIPNTTHNHAASCSVKLSPSLKSSGVAFINVECAQKEAYAVFDTNFVIYQKQPWYGKCAHLHTLIHNMFDWCSLQYTLETNCKPTYSLGYQFLEKNPLKLGQLLPAIPLYAIISEYFSGWAVPSFSLIR